MAERYSETQKKITRESIFSALMILLKKHPFNEITITQIAKIAGVSRVAFYRNYTTKEDIINYYLQELFEQLLTQLQALQDKSKLNRTKLFFTFFQNQNQLIETLINAELSHIFYEQFCLYVTDFFVTQTNKFSRSPLFEKYLSQYIASGLFRVLIDWIKNGMTESIDDIAQFMFEVTGS